MGDDGRGGAIVNETADTDFVSDRKLDDAEHDILTNVPKTPERLREDVHGLDGLAAEKGGMISSAQVAIRLGSSAVESVWQSRAIVNCMTKGQICVYTLHPLIPGVWRVSGELVTLLTFDVLTTTNCPHHEKCTLANLLYRNISN